MLYTLRFFFLFKVQCVS